MFYISDSLSIHVIWVIDKWAERKVQKLIYNKVLSKVYFLR